ncbi:MAG: hypothetical protein ACTHJP_06395 [Rhodanobacteraceae bacterium]
MDSGFSHRRCRREPRNDDTRGTERYRRNSTTTNPCGGISTVASMPIPAGGVRACEDHGLPGGRIEFGRILLPGYSVFFAEMDSSQPTQDVEVDTGTVAGA